MPRPASEILLSSAWMLSSFSLLKLKMNSLVTVGESTLVRLTEADRPSCGLFTVVGSS